MQTVMQSGDKSMTSTSIATDPTLRQGDSGAAVTEQQQLLNVKGINITVDGVFGDATRVALVQFQQQNGLAADGIVGTQTWQALRRGGNAPIQLSDAAIYYEPSNYPYQKEAFECLQSQLSSSVLEELALQNLGMISPNFERNFNGFSNKFISHLCNAEEFARRWRSLRQRISHRSQSYSVHAQIADAGNDLNHTVFPSFYCKVPSLLQM
jgi:hypothetical protein